MSKQALRTVPRKESNLNIRIPTELLEALAKYAATTGESVSTVVRMALRDRLKSEGFYT